MSRLIDADEAKENACKWECGGDPSCPYSKSNGITHEQCEFMRAIDECRTIDAVPVAWINKHLEWLDHCSNDFAQLAKVSILGMLELWRKDGMLNGQTD